MTNEEYLHIQAAVIISYARGETIEVGKIVEVLKQVQNWTLEGRKDG